MNTKSANPLRKFFDPSDETSPTFIFDTVQNGELLDTINIAIALGRPMLVTGPAGVGKSAIARGVKDAVAGSQMFRVTVTSRSEPDDLKWEFDEMQRLSDASSGKEDLDAQKYLRPGLLWQVLNPADALKHFGEKCGEAPEELKAAANTTDALRILLIDEMDKGDMDFANDLLDVFEDGSFRVKRLGHIVKRDEAKILIVITSNQEKAFSDAFTRRCLPIELPFVDKHVAVRIGVAHSKLLSENGAGDPLDEKTVLSLIQGPSAKDKNYSPARTADLVAAAMAFKAQGANLDEATEKLTDFFNNINAVSAHIGGA